jgi:hypothetical protein
MCAHRLKKMVTLVRREAAGGSTPASNGEVSTHRAPSLVARLAELILWIEAAQRAPQRAHGGRWGHARVSQSLAKLQDFDNSGKRDPSCTCSIFKYVNVLWQGANMPEGVTQLDLTGAVDPELEQLRAERLAQLQQSGGKFVQIVGGGAAVSAEEEDDGDDEVCAHAMNVPIHVRSWACIAQRMNALLEEAATAFMLSADPCRSEVDRVQPHPPRTPHHTAFTLRHTTPHSHYATPHRIHISLHHITSPPDTAISKKPHERERESSYTNTLHSNRMPC